MKYSSSPIRNFLFAGVILVGIILFAIKNGNLEINPDPESPHITVQAPKKSTEVPVTEKLNAYTFGINRMALRAHESYARHDSWVDIETGPTGKERHIYGLYELYELEPIKARFEKVKTQSPQLPELEQAGDAYITSLLSLVELVRGAKDYYDQKDYLDDGMATGKTLHPGLVESFEAYFIAEKKLRARLAHYQGERKEALLAEADTEETRLFAQGMRSMDLTTALMEQAISEELFSLDAANLSDGIEKAQGAWDKLGEMTPSNTLGYAEDPAKDFIKSAKEVMRRARDQQAFSQSEALLLQGNGAWMVEGSQGRLVNSYNQLVSAYNSANPDGLHWLKVIPPKSK